MKEKKNKSRNKARNKKGNKVNVKNSEIVKGSEQASEEVSEIEAVKDTAKDEEKDAVIKISDLTKVYHLYPNERARLKEILNPFSHLCSSLKPRLKLSEEGESCSMREHYALDHVSLTIPPRGCVGIIGTNGSGKSTLLKIISKVVMPTGGTVQVTGRISAILELGAGFHPEYTGRENIMLNASINGYAKADADKRAEEIIAFAGIGAYIDQPVKNYSSGMFARLAFAVSVHTDPDILIVDEALSVGDIAFQQKCFRKMQTLKREKTVLFVSHDMGAVVKFCDRVIWLEKGKICADGNPEDVIRQYQRYLAQNDVEEERRLADDLSCSQSKTRIRKRGKQRKKDRRIHEVNHENVYEKTAYENENYVLEKIPAGRDGFGTGQVRIEAAGLFREDEKEPVHLLQGSERLTFVMRIHKTDMPEGNPIAGFTIADRLGTTLFGINSYLIGKDMKTDRKDELCICHFTLPPLNEGVYAISPAYAVGTQAEHTMLHWVYDAYVFQVVVPFEKTLEGVLAVTDFTYETTACRRNDHNDRH